MSASEHTPDRAAVLRQLTVGVALVALGTIAIAWGYSGGDAAPLPGPRLELAAAEIDLGEVGQTETASGTILAHNTGDQRVVIERLESA